MMLSYQHLVATALLSLLAFGMQGYERAHLVLAVTMLGLPMLDRSLQVNWLRFPLYRDLVLVVLCLLSVEIVEHSAKTDIWLYFIAGLVFVALPEEFFFRGYLLSKFGIGWGANIIVSLIFSCLHPISTGEWTTLLVFFPSLLLGWLYQRMLGLLALSLLHAVFNVLWYTFVQDIVAEVLYF